MAKIVDGAGYTRKTLGEILPLDTPLALHIFASNICNLKCGYCLHSLEVEKKNKLLKKQNLMQLDVIEKVVDDIQRFEDRLKVVIFAGWGEPLMHPDLAEMIAKIKTAEVAERVEVVSNGVLLSEAKAKDLISAGLDRIRISIQGITSESCQKVTNVPFDFNKFVANISNFYSKKKQCAVYLKTVNQAVPSQKEKETFYSIFENMCDEIAIENIIPVIDDVDHSQFGNSFEKRHCGGFVQNIRVCPFPFYMSVVHPDGSYAPCCAPEFPRIFSAKQYTSIYETWNSVAMKNFRIAHLEGKRGDNPICRSCVRPKYDTQEGDVLDKFAEQLLPKYIEKGVLI